MVQIELTSEERDILLSLLDGCLSDLHSEIIRTENYEYREMLKNRRLALLKLSDALSKSKETPVAV